MAQAETLDSFHAKETIHVLLKRVTHQARLLAKALSSPKEQDYKEHILSSSVIMLSGFARAIMLCCEWVECLDGESLLREIR